MTISLDVINQRARAHAFDIDAIDWSQPIDRDRHFYPEQQTPLAFTPTWTDVLNDDERRLANQHYACAVSEQFIFLEEAFLMPAVRAMLRLASTKRDPALVEALEVFLIEEQKHGDMFRRLLEVADPDRYGARRRRRAQQQRDPYRCFFTPGTISVQFGALCFSLPTVFIAWPWMGHILEEKTIALHRAYERASADGIALDGLHHAVHRYHFLDEARHVQLEQVLIERLWDPASPHSKHVNRALLFKALGSYTRPRARGVSANIIRAVVRSSPRLEAYELRWLSELSGLRSDTRFQEALYGTSAIPQTFRALQSRPELHGIDVVAPAFVPQAVAA